MYKTIPSREWANVHNPLGINGLLLLRTAELQFVVAEDSEKTADKMTQQTGTLVTQTETLTATVRDLRRVAETMKGHSIMLNRLTWGLLLLTAALLIAGIFDIKVPKVSPAHPQGFSTQRNHKVAAPPVTNR